ncbi:hypothetical protein ABZY68_33190 [Streptomyces sp. NPDC006482]|uniref:hypothetical protein n=1 Tax=Streptomyces sp. NPDC006482 TaxID=3154306 RepID=UPI0033B4895C
MIGRIGTPVNRAVLGVLGAALVLLAAALAAGGTPWSPRLSSWWPLPGPGTALLDAGTLAELRACGGGGRTPLWRPLAA